jgi:hypothetical protein
VCQGCQGVGVVEEDLDLFGHGGVLSGAANSERLFQS